MSEAPTLGERIKVARWLLTQALGAEHDSDTDRYVNAAIMVLGGE